MWYSAGALPWWATSYRSSSSLIRALASLSAITRSSIMAHPFRPTNWSLLAATAFWAITLHPGQQRARRPAAFSGAAARARRYWIGSRVFILPGVHIGHHAVIGAGSVVTKDVPPHCVAVGNPARVVRSVDAQPTSKRSDPIF